MERSQSKSPHDTDQFEQDPEIRKKVPQSDHKDIVDDQPHFSYGLLDPRNPQKFPEAAATNDAVLEGEHILGIEVTVPALAKRCTLGNIDPQHTDGKTDRAAIQDACDSELPPKGAKLVTVRPDPDSIGAMAILELRAKGALPDDSSRLGSEVGFVCGRCGYDHPTGTFCGDLSKILERKNEIAAVDCASRGAWPGPKPLPSRDNPWPDGLKTYSCIGAAVVDKKLTIAERVQIMKQWLISGEEPAGYAEQVANERKDLIRALENKEIEILSSDYNEIIKVNSKHRAATMIGYSYAPIVIARNPEFKHSTGNIGQKYTLCQFELGWVDLPKCIEELNALEENRGGMPEWGGTPTIIGSPQGSPSVLTMHQIETIVTKHILKARKLNPLNYGE